MAVEGKLFPVFDCLPESGYLVILLRENGDPDDPDVVFVVSAGLSESTAAILAEFFQSSSTALISFADLDSCLDPAPGSTWNFAFTEARGGSFVDLVRKGRLLRWPSRLEPSSEAVSGLIANLNLQAGESFEPQGPLPHCDYAELRRRVFGFRAREMSDRMHGLAPLRDHTAELIETGRAEALDLHELKDDLDHALAGDLSQSRPEEDASWCVVIDTERALRVPSLVTAPMSAGFRTVVIAYGASLGAACWLHAIIKANPVLFLRSDRLVSDPTGDEKIRSVRIVRESELGWVGIDLAGRRNSEAYDALVELVDGFIEGDVVASAAEVIEFVSGALKKPPRCEAP